MAVYAFSAQGRVTTAAVGQGDSHRYPAAMSTYTCPKCGNVESIRPAAKLFYTMNEVADLFEVCRRTIHRRIQEGDIRVIKFGRVVRIPAKSLKRYLAAT